MECQAATKKTKDSAFTNMEMPMIFFFGTKIHV